MLQFSHDPTLSPAFYAAKTLHTELKKAGDIYFSQSPTLDSYRTFQTTCSREITAARRVLDTHANWNKILLNILAIVSTGVIGYAIAAGINYAINKKFTFFSTDSSLKIDAVEKTIRQFAAPSA